MNENNHTATDKSLLELRDIAISIKNHEIVSGAELLIRPGETVGLVGESGSGKTMLCRTAIGLLGPIGGQVTRGSVLVQGKTIDNGSSKDWKQIRGNVIGFVPQASLAGLDPLMRIGHQLKETIRRLDSDANPGRRALELLENVQINRPTEVLRAYPHQLSGGMRQRVMIALALAGRPKLIIADEATTALDATVQRSVLNLLRDIQKETNMALLLVTHDLSIVRQMADQVYVMLEGRTVESGPVAQVLENPQHPYTEALLKADPSQGGLGVLPHGGGPKTATVPNGWADSPHPVSVSERGILHE